MDKAQTITFVAIAGLVLVLAMFCILYVFKADNLQKRVNELAAAKTCAEHGYTQSTLLAPDYHTTVECSHFYGGNLSVIPVEYNTSVGYEQCCLTTHKTTITGMPC